MRMPVLAWLNNGSYKSLARMTLPWSITYMLGSGLKPGKSWDRTLDCAPSPPTRMLPCAKVPSVKCAVTPPQSSLYLKRRFFVWTRKCSQRIWRITLRFAEMLYFGCPFSTFPMTPKSSCVRPSTMTYPSDFSALKFGLAFFKLSRSSGRRGSNSSRHLYLPSTNGPSPLKRVRLTYQELLPILGCVRRHPAQRSQMQCPVCGESAPKRVLLCRHLW